jgi:superfamily II DNA/RNA helicase
MMSIHEEKALTSDGAAAGGGGAAASYPNPPPPYKEWDSIPEFRLDKLSKILAHIYAMGWSVPTLVQQQVVRPMLLGFPIVCKTPPGSGKTGTFLIGLMSRLLLEDIPGGSVRAIIVVNSHQVAEQIFSVANKFIDCNKTYPIPFHPVLCIGGPKESVADNHRAIRTGLESDKSVFLIGTMGRILHIIKDNPEYTANLKTLIVDEFDSMIRVSARGSEEQLVGIMEKIPETISVQICFFSATMSTEVQDNIDRINPGAVKVIEDALLVNIKKRAVYASDSKTRLSPEILFNRRLEALFELLDNNFTNNPKAARILVYTCDKREVEKISTQINENFPEGTAQFISSDVIDRGATIEALKTGTTKVLVSTHGVTGRGIDILDVSEVIVFNGSKIDDIEEFTHLFGRTGRHGKTGMATIIVTSEDVSLIKKLEEKGIRIELLEDYIRTA